jgi:hypothetical protein
MGPRIFLDVLQKGGSIIENAVSRGSENSV